jgi:hypothetical protein
MKAEQTTNTGRQTTSQIKQVEQKLKDLTLLSEIIANCDHCKAKFAELRRLH